MLLGILHCPEVVNKPVAQSAAQNSQPLAQKAAGPWRCLLTTFSLATPWGSWEELRSELQCQDAASVGAGLLLPSWVPSHPSCSAIACSAWKLPSPVWKAAHGLASRSCGWRLKRPLSQTLCSRSVGGKGSTPMPCRFEKMEGQVVGTMLRLFRNRLPRLRAGSRQDNLREAVKEPERAPEHCLSTFAGGQHFFEYLFVVSLKKKSSGHDYEPTITYQFPKRENLLRGQQEEEERLLSAIPLFCFPDGNEWAPLTEYPRETFSFVLTNVDGSRKIGYCRRLLPAGRGPRLPKVYCIISCIGCFGLFSKILDEVEKRHQISVAVIYPFMQGLREAAFPAPGKTVTLKSFIPDSGTEFISLTRPLDSHLEHVDFRSLLRCLRFEQILQIFASAVLERRIIFLAEDLSTLSQCIHAAAALLYPFSWAHTYIPVVPESLLDTVCCPTPFMVGVQMRFQQQVMDSPMEEVLLVNLCEGTFLMSVGDEKDILPPKLQDDILESLGQGINEFETSEQLNEHVSGPFVQFFVKTVGHYASYIKREANGQGRFQERAFYKALTSKTNRRFVKKFVKTQLFSLFIQEAEKSKHPPAGYFQQKILEYEEQKKQKKSREKTVK
ncbi:DENN domain-containing protein 2D isoform X2 [Panthera tigris]|uniref:DENN domain-containing protein 2D isoform X2 n=1 Tax=Panthera tigris TaxID=9694 RepID=UPI001C6F89A6|nr:DENN domain-containing protein 2D isoform X2 [Panthera tigris]XP_049472542.1 DENN domain-containing protein 2D isoform X2 [Panthera uncia]